VSTLPVSITVPQLTKLFSIDLSASLHTSAARPTPLHVNPARSRLSNASSPLLIDFFIFSAICSASILELEMIRSRRPTGRKRYVLTRTSNKIWLSLFKKADKAGEVIQRNSRN
jgi:hypothetical protein